MPVSHGSSPRLRGTLSPLAPLRGLARFIPAPAGNTCADGSGAVMTPVHPRACGEHSIGAPAAKYCRGSSPRLRGTHLPLGTMADKERFIPAPAGNTSPRTPCRAAQRGSSPRLRGTPPPQPPIPLRIRFIPAPAGNTLLGRWLGCPFTVHPRACGEHTTQVRFRCKKTGSSPRLRGTHVRVRRRRGEHRFIPAPAGNTPIVCV